MRERLVPQYGKGEADALTQLAMEHVFCRGKVDLLLSLDKEAGEPRIEMIDRITGRLLTGEPIQYILGEETFMGFKLKVTSDVLIPRPETEQLVELVAGAEGNAADLRVLDAGTGSGAIAIALSRNLRFPQVTAVDISDKALVVAQENASALHAPVKFVKGDMLTLDAANFGPFDVIVSNPPYVLNSEKSSMESNVLEHEPAGALFVDDSDPLEFYLALESFARKGGLVPGGRMYFEVNPLTIRELADKMEHEGWEDVTVSRDSFGSKRFLSAKRTSDRWH